MQSSFSSVKPFRALQPYTTPSFLKYPVLLQNSGAHSAPLFFPQVHVYQGLQLILRQAVSLPWKNGDHTDFAPVSTLYPFHDDLIAVYGNIRRGFRLDTSFIYFIVP